MNYKAYMNAILLATGFLIGILAANAPSMQPSWESLPDGQYEQGNLITGFATSLSGIPDQESPKDRIRESDISVFGDRVELDIQNAQWSTFTDTNSMDPVIDQGANAIQIVPKSAEEIEVGDIISYASDYANGIIIHRVIFKGEDEQGIYFVAKGDNIPTSDPGKIRFEQIKRVVVAIIY